jgi:hypothetical protein
MQEYPQKGVYHIGEPPYGGRRKALMSSAGKPDDIIDSLLDATEGIDALRKISFDEDDG